jgi:myosin heavy subunit
MQILIGGSLYRTFLFSVLQTYSGLFCVAINPYKRYPIYTARAMKIYHGRRRNEVPPHIFAIADGAYSEMMTNHMNQSILIT